MTHDADETPDPMPPAQEKEIKIDPRCPGPSEAKSTTKPLNTTQFLRDLFRKTEFEDDRRLFGGSVGRAFSSGAKKMVVAETHYVLKGNRMQPPFPEGMESSAFGTGCFWGTVSEWVSE